MRVYTIMELMRMTRSELCGLLAEAEHVLSNPTSDEPEQTQARANISAIRLALLRPRGPAP